jgi:hypothetical protein
MLAKVISQQSFDTKLVPMLQKIGNKRLPFLILSDHKYSTETLRREVYASCKTITLEGIAPDDLIDLLLDTKYDICIMYCNDIADYEHLLAITNEVHTDKAMDMPGYICHNFGYVYTAKALDYQVYAYSGAKCQIQSPTLQPWQPWHTLIFDASQNTLYQVIWDLRLIVGYHTPDSEQINAIRQLKPADDNRRMLYNATDCAMTNSMAFRVSELSMTQILNQ